MMSMMIFYAFFAVSSAQPSNADLAYLQYFSSLKAVKPFIYLGEIQVDEMELIGKTLAFAQAPKENHVSYFVTKYRESVRHALRSIPIESIDAIPASLEKLEELFLTALQYGIYAQASWLLSMVHASKHGNVFENIPPFLPGIPLPDIKNELHDTTLGPQLQASPIHATYDLLANIFKDGDVSKWSAEESDLFKKHIKSLNLFSTTEVLESFLGDDAAKNYLDSHQPNETFRIALWQNTVKKEIKRRKELPSLMRVQPAVHVS